MTAVDISHAPARRGDLYLLFLSGILAGYATLGKGFGYLGFPPIYVGEMALLLGTIVVLRIGNLLALLASAPALALAAIMAWTMALTLLGVGAYGVDALRDGVVIMYGGFSFIVLALLLDDPRRLNTILDHYGAFVRWCIPVLPVLFAISYHLHDYVPDVPGTRVPVIWIGPGAVAVHLAGAAVFVMAGFRKARPLWIAALVVGVVMTGAVSRSSTLAFVLTVAGAAVALGRFRQLAATVLVGAAILAVAYGAESAFRGTATVEKNTERTLSAVQIVNNLKSIFGSNEDKLEGTREWRLEWWKRIVDRTVFGDRFWTGEGFGLNIAMADRFGNPHRRVLLRSPHNVNITILARAGVPGLTMWGLFLISWAGTMAKCFLSARRHAQSEWAGLFLWVGCYAAACVINASFDVALEGPMQGIWFWSLIGLGLGAAMIFYCPLSSAAKTKRKVAQGSA